MQVEFLRILDANANRAREALRILEDYARFALDDAALTADLKGLRHDFAGVLAGLPMDQAILARDTPGDVGTGISTSAEYRRDSDAHLLAANAKRLSEALRSMEESAKVLASDGGGAGQGGKGAAEALEQLRYRGYALEQRLLLAVRRRSAVERFGAVRLYVLLTDSLCLPGMPAPWECTLDRILAAAGGKGGGEGAGPGKGGYPPASLCIQLREKGLPGGDAELLRRAAHFAARCRAAGVLSVINDRPDIAQLAGADGVHLGQTDLPCAAARQLLGPDRLIGISTENLDQATAAARAGASYIAVGPMFPTTTKHKPRIAGPAYAAEAVAAFPRVPLVAIGGITPENVSQLTAAGIRRVAVSSAILRASDPAAAIAAFLSALPPPAHET